MCPAILGKVLSIYARPANVFVATLLCYYRIQLPTEKVADWFDCTLATGKLSCWPCYGTGCGLQASLMQSCHVWHLLQSTNTCFTVSSFRLRAFPVRLRARQPHVQQWAIWQIAFSVGFGVQRVAFADSAPFCTTLPRWLLFLPLNSRSFRSGKSSHSCKGFRHSQSVLFIKEQSSIVRGSVYSFMPPKEIPSNSTTWRIVLSWSIQYSQEARTMNGNAKQRPINQVLKQIKMMGLNQVYSKVFCPKKLQSHM